LFHSRKANQVQRRGALILVDRGFTWELGNSSSPPCPVIFWFLLRRIMDAKTEQSFAWDYWMRQLLSFEKWDNFGMHYCPVNYMQRGYHLCRSSSQIVLHLCQCLESTVLNPFLKKP
jgi:hypothetical protein